MFFLTMTLNVEEERIVQELYEQYGKQMLGYAYQFLQSYELAEDVVHEAFLRIFNNLEKISQMECRNRKAYLVKVIERICIDTYNREKRQQRISAELDLCEPEPEGMDSLWEGFDAQLTREWLLEELGRLSAQDRDLLAYRVLHGWTYREIAEMTGLGESNISVRISRLRKRLYRRYCQKKKEGEL